MNICILTAGRLNSEGESVLPEFPALFHALFKANDPEGKIRLSHMTVLDGMFPKSVRDFDGYLITGSPFSVYEDVTWIHHLMDFTCSAFAKGLPQVGICFGHQILAQALGGRVEKADKGWGLGLRRTSIIAGTPWMDQDPPSTVDLIYVHRDQVTKLPPNSRRVLGDDFCPIGGFSIAELVFTIQGHPELTEEICATIIRRRIDSIGPDQVRTALKTLHTPHHGHRIAKWIVNFFKRYEVG